MTGRRLYDHYTDALSVHRHHWSNTPSELAELPRAWPYLSSKDRKVWNDLARRLTPKPKKRTS